MHQLVDQFRRPIEQRVRRPRLRPCDRARRCGAELHAAGVQPIGPAVPFPRPDGTPGASAPRHPLALDRVRYVGEAVAAVVAESREAALDGAEAIVVDYEELPAVTDPFAAMRPGAPLLCDAAPDNIAAEMRHGDAAPLQNSADSPAPTELLDSPELTELPELIELAELTDPPELTELPAPAELVAAPQQHAEHHPGKAGKDGLVRQVLGKQIIDVDPA